MKHATTIIEPKAHLHVRNRHLGFDETSLSAIYRAEINISIWRRQLDQSIDRAAQLIIKKKPNLQFSSVVKTKTLLDTLINSLSDDSEMLPLYNDMLLLVDMFCFLFDIKEAGLRLTVLKEVMCARFHVDRVPCRLVSTYCGVGTEWIPNHWVDRSKLGAGNQGLPDAQSGIYGKTEYIHCLQAGDVALLKGEQWVENEGKGLVHRSPKPKQHQNRLLLTLDF